MKLGTREDEKGFFSSSLRICTRPGSEDRVVLQIDIEHPVKRFLGPTDSFGEEECVTQGRSCALLARDEVAPTQEDVPCQLVHLH